MAAITLLMKLCISKAIRHVDRLPVGTSKPGSRSPEASSKWLTFLPDSSPLTNHQSSLPSSVRFEVYVSWDARCRGRDVRVAKLREVGPTSDERRALR